MSFSLTHRSRPPVVKSEGAPPALLLLHGYGSNEDDLMGLAPYLDPRLQIITPRAPLTLPFGMYAWYNIEYLSGGDFRISEAEARASIEILERFVDEIVESYDFDPARLFIGGFSQGSIQSLGMLLRQPERFAGALAVCGRWPTPVEGERAADERLAGKPVVAIHGLYDEVIPIRYGREVRDKLEALPVELSYREYRMGHEINAESLAFVSEWLTQRITGS